MECMIPGTQKNRVKKMFNINAPIRPVVSIAAGGNKKHKKYLMIILLSVKVKAESKKLFRYWMIIMLICYAQGDTKQRCELVFSRPQKCPLGHRHLDAHHCSHPGCRLVADRSLQVFDACGYIL